jgi:hypothetical protein
MTSSVATTWIGLLPTKLRTKSLTRIAQIDADAVHAKTQRREAILKVRKTIAGAGTRA